MHGTLPAQTLPAVRTFLSFNDTATTDIYTLSLHDALPICIGYAGEGAVTYGTQGATGRPETLPDGQSRLVYRRSRRSEEHTSELQSQSKLVCRLLLEKKKTVTVPASIPDSPSRERENQAVN